MSLACLSLFVLRCIRRCHWWYLITESYVGHVTQISDWPRYNPKYSDVGVERLTPDAKSIRNDQSNSEVGHSSSLVFTYNLDEPSNYLRLPKAFLFKVIQDFTII